MAIVAIALAPAFDARGAPPLEHRTRNAVFERTTFEALPGWLDDSLDNVIPALRLSCSVLSRRAYWQAPCANLPPDDASGAEVRRFLQDTLTPLRIRSTQADAEGDLTGYFEPLLEGRSEPDAAFSVPVFGVPRDLLTLDWTRLPPAQRNGRLLVRREGQALVPLAGPEPDAIEVDLDAFSVDTLDRRLRLRLARADDGRRIGVPYYSRTELAALGTRLEAPVLAWVKDPLALYGMQVQGSGRIRLANGRVLRLAFGDANGQPFRPLRVSSRPMAAVVTRSVGGTADVTSEFELEPEPDAAPAAIRTRGLGSGPSAAASGRSTVPETNPAVLAMIEQLLAGAQPVPPARRAPAAPPPAPAPAPAPAPGPARPIDASLLLSDPSYVFFRVAPDQSPRAGPPGALGVPLTPGRSVAIDPRVTPLGYPLWLAAAPGEARPLQRLVLAQDTGGAIRGAVRADYFWGYGAAAGQLARGTRQRSQLWLLMPLAEAERLLLPAGVATRGLTGPGAGPAGGCLLADDEFCPTP